MNLHKTENNLQQFEKSTSKAIYALLSVLVIITIMFASISYKSYTQQNDLKLKDIESAISLFQTNLSEKLSIIVSSNVFIEFLTSGKLTRETLEPRFLTELLPLKSSGIIGYSLKNFETNSIYSFGESSTESIAIKLCYLANHPDSENGSCRGTLKLYFSKKKVINILSRINNTIKSCDNCKTFNFSNKGYFGDFLIDGNDTFNLNINSNIKYDTSLYYYIIIIFILFIFALLSRAKLRRIIKKSISNPIDLIVQKLKNQEILTDIRYALYEINYLASEIEEGKRKISKMNEYEKKAALGYLAAGVAHDIRSPLAVMELTISSLNQTIPDQQLSILRKAIQSVRDISNNLLEQHRSSKDAKNLELQDDSNIIRPLLLPPLLEEIISQKRYEWQNNPCNIQLKYSTTSKSIWSNLSPNDIKRTISNILNNAYESLIDKRNIDLDLDISNGRLILKISDSGRGMSENQIQNALTGISSKRHGNGLGLCTAKKYLENIGGLLSLNSSPLSGTVVSLTIPTCKQPSWFPNSINLEHNSIIVIIDDDQSIHSLWRHRFNSLGYITKHFSNSQSFYSWHHENKNVGTPCIYLVDYNLKDELNGLDILKQVNPKHLGYLVTSHSAETYIQNLCQTLGVWLIAKELSADISINIC